MLLKYQARLVRRGSAFAESRCSLRHPSDRGRTFLGLNQRVYALAIWRNVNPYASPIAVRQSIPA